MIIFSRHYYILPINKPIIVGRNDKAWKSWFDSPEESPLPDGYEPSLDVFSKTLLIRSWCPHRTMAQSRKYITDSMGSIFVDAVILNMDDMLKESEIRTPLICFLSIGSDQTETNDAEVRAISMGQGQEIHPIFFTENFKSESKIRFQLASSSKAQTDTDAAHKISH